MDINLFHWIAAHFHSAAIATSSAVIAATATAVAVKTKSVPQWLALCIPLTKKSESCKLTAYWDPDGKVWTIGYGQTGPHIHEGLVWTQQQAEDALIATLMSVGVTVDHYVTVILAANEKAALVDFTYNVGAGNFAGSTLLKLLNAGNRLGAANEFAKWNLSGGKVLGGLVTRRAAERKLFIGA